MAYLLLPFPGTKVSMSKTEMTVGEWNLYLKTEGLPGWQQPEKNWKQDDEHPVVKISWNEAQQFCEGLRAKTGKGWRLPTNAEWEAAVGTTTDLWGNYFPPKWEDGNYAVLVDGKDDPQKVRVDVIKGTAPVGSFKPNVLGFYDLAGNVWEWIWDGLDEKNFIALRGSSWGARGDRSRSSSRISIHPGTVVDDRGLRLVRSSTR